MKRVIYHSSPIVASHMYVKDASIKSLLASDLFEFMNDAYKWIGGFQSFTGEDDFADRSYLWMITYAGNLPDSEKDIEISKVYTVSVYKQKYGLKLVGIGNNRFEDLPKPERQEYKVRAKNALIQHIKFAMNRGWAEVSGAAEKMFNLAIDSSYIIEPEWLKETVPEFEDIEILPDNLHYSRILSNGTEVTKIAYGNLRLD